MTQTALEPVRKTISVKASRERAFEVFTKGIDTWWPRTHHIGTSPLAKTILEQRKGGRCYSRHTDGAECDWGSVLVWEPPQRVVIAWQITPTWTHQPDVLKSSEVEVRFTAEAGGTTRVDLEHRNLERHGEGAEAMHAAVGSSNGWTAVLDSFAARVEQEGV